MNEHVEASALTRRELLDLLNIVRRVAGEAAGFLRDKFGVEEYTEVVLQHSYDADEGLRIDVENEKHIIELLRTESFNGYFLGEEHGLTRISDGPFIAVVDPLDGSKNYASLIPWSAVSIAIAVMPRGREPRLSDVVAGAIAPVHSWPVVSFARGLGVYEGGSKASPRRPPTRMILAYFEDIDQARVVQRYMELAPGRPLRSLGSACLEITWTGLGRAEVFIDVRGKLRVVDVAAAVWVAAESGSTVVVENLGASLMRVERVGSVAVASSSDSMKHLAKALESEGHGHLLKSIFKPRVD